MRSGPDANLPQALDVRVAVHPKTVLIAPRGGDSAASFEQPQVACRDAHGFSSGAYVNFLNCGRVHRYNRLYVDTRDTV